MLKGEMIHYQAALVANLWRRFHYRKLNIPNMTFNERRVLVAIDLFPSTPQSLIADKLDMEPQNLLRVLNRLEAAGYINRSTSKTDKRVNLLSTTKKGDAVIKQIYAFGEVLYREITKDIPEEDLEVTRRVLKTMQNRLSHPRYESNNDQ